MSPSQIWANYDIENIRLKSNFIKYDTSKEIIDFEAYISNDDGNEESILTYTYGKLNKSKSKATIIYINGFSTYVENEVFELFLPHGYNVVCFDYMGKSSKEKYTIYPKNLEFANYALSGQHLHGFVDSPKDSCVYVWSKICRDVITFVKNTIGQDQKIVLLSSVEGGNILWQVAGIDKRVDAIIPSNNAGWSECRGLFKYSTSPDEYNFSEQTIRFISACSPQAYAKFVKCPVYCLLGTNGSMTSVDRIQSTLSLVQNDGNTKLCLCPNLTNTTSAKARTSMRIWLNNTLDGVAMPAFPSLNFVVEDNNLYAKVDFDQTTNSEIESLTIYYSYNEDNSELRHWNKTIISTASSMSQIPVRKDDVRVFAFASIIYKDGQYYSSLPKMFDLDNVPLERITPKRSHIIYERKLGINAWVVDNNTSEYYLPEIKAGAYDILGITAKKGDLSTYIIGDNYYERTDTSILQFDCYTSCAREFSVMLCVEMQKAKYEYYFATIPLGGGEWQKISLHTSDFKTKELVPLKSWNNVKKLSFVKIDDTLISNIIWL